ncbi:hypothetical protein SAMN05444000_102266 [Shimia gijangensis]|uniref:Uncharacterized protein n=1 Tax=Shimia gijangensis TaxID=1470563 RepID=A0A1M6DA28_9RHOB|nr:hypothetical protein SAMN05444000_102266 [Shimia gijangensis]
MFQHVLRCGVLSSFFVVGASLVLPVSGAHASSSGFTKPTSAGHGAASFDWLSRSGNAKKDSLTIASSKNSLGNGEWICSAAGFGKQAKCYRR